MSHAIPSGWADMLPGADTALPLPARPALSAGTALLLLDASALAALHLAALAFWGGDGLGLLPGGLATLMFMYALGLHRRAALLQLQRSCSQLPLAAALGAGVGWTGQRLLGLGFAPDVVSPGVAAAGWCGAGLLARMAFTQLCRRKLLLRRILVVGAGRRAWELDWLLRTEGRSLAYELLFVTDAAMGAVDERLPRERVLALVSDVDFLSLARRFGAEEIVVAPDERRGMKMWSLLDCRLSGYPVTEYLTFLEREIRRIDLRRLEPSWLLYADGFRFGLIDRALKRAVDIVVSLAVLLLASPFLLAAALAVMLEDGGPLLYRQERVTQGGRRFRILKLRTMRQDAERNGAVWAATRDPRVTRVGHFLRRTRLDELPQLFNILAGEMSFVGPRPERPEFVAQLAANMPLYHERHVMKAGLTGWAQVNYPYGASLDDARSKLSYDLYYVKNFSVAFDLLIVLQTIRVVLWPESVR